MGQAKTRRQNGSYPQAIHRPVYIGHLVHGNRKYNYTQQDFDSAHQEEKEGLITSLHESSHAVAAFLTGVEIHVMKFNSKEKDLVAQCEIGEPMPVMLAGTPEERWILGQKHAFITLSGVIGSGEINSDNPFSKFQVGQHISQALSILSYISGCQDENKVRSECADLLKQAHEMFRKPEIRMMVYELSKRFSENRELTGEEATKILQDVSDKEIPQHETKEKGE